MAYFLERNRGPGYEQAFLLVTEVHAIDAARFPRRHKVKLIGRYLRVTQMMTPLFSELRGFQTKIGVPKVTFLKNSCSIFS